MVYAVAPGTVTPLSPSPLSGTPPTTGYQVTLYEKVKLVKQGPLSVWCHDAVAMVPFTTTHVNVGGAAMSEQSDHFRR